MRKFCYLIISFRNIITVLICVVLCLCAVIGYDVINNYKAASLSLTKKPTVIIDAGHGGEDGGTVSESGVVEKDINLKIAEKLNNLFAKNGYNTVMIRKEDKLIYDDGCNSIRSKKSSDLHNRLNIINENENSVLISIHQNHYTESKYYGAQVFYSGNNPKSEALAQCIQGNIVLTLQPENKRQIKKSGSEIFILNNAKVPAVMVECGFLSNHSEALLLNTEEYQDKMAECIFKATNLFIINGK